MTPLAPIPAAGPFPAGARPGAGAGTGLRRALLEGVRTLNPAYFAMVMATGVLDVACRLLGIRILAEVLFAVNLAAYACLWAATLLRLLRFPRDFLADLQSHQRGPGFFTTVAGTCVVGLQLLVRGHDLLHARILWWTALGLWLLTMYAIFTALTVKPDKPRLEDGINGGWLTAVVATQALSVLGTAVAPGLGLPGESALFLTASLWLCGGMLYIWLISLIFYRYTFLRFLPSDLLPPYWINMGAMAISTLAGALLVKQAPASPFLASMLPFLKGFTLLYWATATWWIPMLLILGLWRHVARQVPLTYDPLYWGAVFPLAMYTSATFRLTEAFGLPFLLAVPRISVAAALTAWLLTFLGLVLSLLQGARRARGTKALPAPTLEPALDAARRPS